MEKLKKIIKHNKVFLLYSLFFIITIIGVYYLFIKQKISFIWDEDGINQHFLILYDFNEMIRNVFSEGFNTFSLNLGLGLDIIGQYSYYILGDLFTIISFVFPLDKLQYAYSLMIIARMFCIGISFIIFCRYKKKGDIPTLIGALVYTFCGFVLYAGIRHPYFLNPLILLPLLLLSVEKLIKENKKVLFIFMIFISSFSNYYFFYMLTIVAVIYGIFTYIFECKNKSGKEFGKLLFKAASCYILGVLMSAIILLPSICAFLNSSREESKALIEYTSSYYNNFLMSYISMPGLKWSIVQISVICIPIIGLLLYNWKQNKKEVVILITMTIMLLIPQIGSLMNGFSYPTNRWSFANSFIIAYIVTNLYKPDFSYAKKDLIAMIIFSSVFLNLTYMFAKYSKYDFNVLFMAIILMAVFILIILINYWIKNIKSEKIKRLCTYISNVCVILITMASIIMQANSYYSNNYITEFDKYKDIKKLYSTEQGKIDYLKDAIEYIKENDNTIYRIAKYPVLNLNTSILYNYNGISSYYSISNGELYDFVKEMDLNKYNAQQLIDYNNRTDILTLLGTKYLIVDKENLQYVPYGYSLYKEIENTNIYINDNYLSLGIFYDKYITKTQYDSLTTLEKQNSLLEYAKIDKDTNNVEQGNIEEVKEDIEEVKYSTIKKENKQIEIKPIEANEGELYVVINNINFVPKDENSSLKYTLTTTYGDVSVSGEKLGKNASYYIDRKNFIMNLGQIQENENIKIKFKCAEGEVTYDDIKLVLIPNQKYEEQIKDLRKNNFENIQYEGNTISGEINNEKNGILQLSIPYSSGWKVFVNGEEKELLNVNTGFIGVELEAGNNKITFEYSTPGLYIGIILSVIGFIIFIIIIYKDIYLKRKKKL